MTTEVSGELFARWATDPWNRVWLCDHWERERVQARNLDVIAVASAKREAVNLFIGE